MNIRRRLTAAVLVLAFVLGMTGCGNKGTSEESKAAPVFEEDLHTILECMYEKIEKEETREFVKKFGTGEINADNAAYYLGSPEVDFKEAIYAEPMISSIAFSICLVRINEGADMAVQKKLIEDNIDPRKWICVEAESVQTESVGRVLLLVMADEAYADEVVQAFKALNE